MSPETNLAVWAAQQIVAGHDEYLERFSEINRRAPRKFETRDWAGMHTDSVERLLLYQATVFDVVEAVSETLGPQSSDPGLWKSIKSEQTGILASRPNRELAETFHNSITRRIFETVGVDPDVEFVDSHARSEGETPAVTLDFPVSASLYETLSEILLHFSHSVPYADLYGNSEEIATRLNGGGAAETSPVSIEMIDLVFYRGQAAYLIGQVHRTDGSDGPMAISLRHGDDGITCDALLLTENEVSILFSFTRSYFHVDTVSATALVGFLKRLMPKKRVAELYISIGQNKHGKTELYRDLLRHLRSTDEKFEHAPGTKGLVMVVFTMPGYDDVFKIIRDRFPPPKRTTRAAIMRKYRMVFQHDRAGRLMDVQDFQHLEFDVSRFDPLLLEELLEEAGNTVSVEGDSVVINHVYVERRITPLDLFVKEANADATMAAVLDYGQAIKDLASTNIFPGDLLVKNFGVTRHGRVVFYDYDELAALTDVNFKEIPPPRDDYDAMADHPWYPVSERDVFPEEHQLFLGLNSWLREVFAQRHGDLFRAASWRAIQQRIVNGELIEVFPYDEAARLPDAAGARGW